MTQDDKDIFRIGATFMLVIFSAVAFYFALFWGWASGAGPVGQPHLKVASEIALVASFTAFWSSVGIWLVPYLLKKRRKSLSSSLHV